MKKSKQSIMEFPTLNKHGNLAGIFLTLCLFYAEHQTEEEGKPIVMALGLPDSESSPKSTGRPTTPKTDALSACELKFLNDVLKPVYTKSDL